MGAGSGDGQTGASGARPNRRLTRRDFLRAGAMAGVAGAVGAKLGSGLSPAQGRLIEAALANAAAAPVSDIAHIVILMQENRSFDHYFGTMQRVRGYSDSTSYSSFTGGPSTDPSTVFTQTMRGTSIDGKVANYALPDGETVLQPFELVSNPPTVAGQTTNDITHDWGPQHGAWNNGRMDRFGVEHLANDPIAAWGFSTVAGIPIPGTSNVPTGITTMGYYRPGDCLSFYRALADAFTICDGYHCSVLGPTDPNRLMSMSGSLGAHSGDSGGAILTTYVQNREQLFGTLNWPTMPEVLSDHNVSWKIYQDPTSNLLFNILTYFQNYLKPSTAAQVQNAVNALTPVFPVQFAADVAAGTLPKVSWILPPTFACEHPATPAEYGEWLVAQILGILTTNPAVWAQTVFLVVYDENGGFFDHVAPPTPGPTVQSVASLPPGLGAGGVLDGEYLTTANPTNAAGGPPADWANVLGPVGLGFRTPALVVSPFSAGGWVCSDVFDHISTLKLIETVFLSPGALTSGADGLHISPWRYNLVGDLTTALPNATAATAVPALPATSLLFPDTATQSLLNSLAGTVDEGQAYPPPTKNTTDYLTQDPEPVGFTRKATPS